MNRYFDSQFNKHIVTIYPGEYHCGGGEEYISTVLGSCISVALYDKSIQFGGLNHFMLAYDQSSSKENDALAGRFGEYAMELLINDMLKHGSSKKHLSAKVFGGSNVLGTGESSKTPLVGDANIKFVFDYLERERIPVISSNTGGDKPRKIFYDPKTSKIWLKHIRKTIKEEEFIKKKESEYVHKVQEKKEHAGDIVWF